MIDLLQVPWFSSVKYKKISFDLSENFNELVDLGPQD